VKFIGSTPRISLGLPSCGGEMGQSEEGRKAPADATAAQSAMQVAAWRQLWRLLLQPTDELSGQSEAASDQEAANEETHDASVHAPNKA